MTASLRRRFFEGVGQQTTRPSATKAQLLCHRHRCSSFGYGWRKSCGFVCKPVVPLQDAYVTLHFTPTPNVTPHKGIRDCSVGAPDDRHDIRHDVRHSSFVTIRRPVPYSRSTALRFPGGARTRTPTGGKSQLPILSYRYSTRTMSPPPTMHIGHCVVPHRL